MSSPPPLARRSLREQVRDALRDDLVTGRMPAGRRYTVKEIAELYGVSATPVREALIQLAAEGLLEAAHLKGYQVRRLTAADFAEILRARRAVLRGMVGEWADSAAPPPGTEQAAGALRRGRAAAEAVRAGPLDVLVVSDLRYWREVGALLGGSHLVDFLDGLRAQSWMYLVPMLRGRPAATAPVARPGHWSRHIELVERIAEGDRDGVPPLLMEHQQDAVRLAGAAVGERVAAGADPRADFPSPR